MLRVTTWRTVMWDQKWPAYTSAPSYNGSVQLHAAQEAALTTATGAETNTMGSVAPRSSALHRFHANLPHRKHADAHHRRRTSGRWNLRIDIVILRVAPNVVPRRKPCETSSQNESSLKSRIAVLPRPSCPDHASTENRGYCQETACVSYWPEPPARSWHRDSPW